MAALAGPFNTGWCYQPVLKGGLYPRLTEPGLKGGPLVPEGQHRLGNRGNRPFPTGANARTCGSDSFCRQFVQEKSATYSLLKSVILKTAPSQLVSYILKDCSVGSFGSSRV